MIISNVLTPMSSGRVLMSVWISTVIVVLIVILMVTLPMWLCVLIVLRNGRCHSL